MTQSDQASSRPAASSEGGKVLTGDNIDTKPEEDGMLQVPPMPTADRDDSTMTMSNGSSIAEENDARSISSIDPADGEYHQLMQSVEDDSPPLTMRVAAALQRQLSQKHLTEASWYGSPLSAPEALAIFSSPPEIRNNNSRGLVWHALVIPDVYLVKGKLTYGLNSRDFEKVDNASGGGQIKPRRPSMPLTATQFFSSITKITNEDDDDDDALHQKSSSKKARYIFHGVLNGWPGLRDLELIVLERRRDSTVLPSARELLTGQILWVKSWTEEEDGARGIDPKIEGSHRVYRATLRGPPWTSIGWSKTSPGFCFWYESQRAAGPRVSFGSNILSEIETEPQCTHLHMISHRYAVSKVESPRDRLTYHSICLLEWDHGKYCTVIESAYLNGMGGYKGQSNWYDDRDSPVTSLYQALPLEMVCPWRTSQSEIRCYDVPVTSVSEFRAFMTKYEGYGKRFLDPRFTFSHPARLTFRSKTNIAQYLLNYIMRDNSYAELKRNCQTFTADLCSFLAGKKGIAPFHPVNRIEYQNRTYLFLYDSHLYEKRSTKK